MSCEFAKDVGMERVGHCPEGMCAYAYRFILTAGLEDSYVGSFVSEQKAFDYAREQEYDVYEVNPENLIDE